MQAAPHIANLAQVIQLAVAPVFLLAGVGATLNVLATRVARVVDRARLMENALPSATEAQALNLHRRLRVLSRRATLVNVAIGLCVLCGLLVSLVVATLFVSYSVGIDLSMPIAIAFVVALLSLAASLVCFLLEVIMATRSLTFGGVRPEHPLMQSKD